MKKQQRSTSMANYRELSLAWLSGREYKYNKHLQCTGNKIIELAHYQRNAKGAYMKYDTPRQIVLAETIKYKYKTYHVIYNRSNKCGATYGLWWFNYNYRARVSSLKYGEIGKPTLDQQVCYRSQLIDNCLVSGATHYLIPTSIQGESEFFKKL